MSPLLSELTDITEEYVSERYPAALRLTFCPDATQKLQAVLYIQFQQNRLVISDIYNCALNFEYIFDCTY